MHEAIPMLVRVGYVPRSSENNVGMDRSRRQELAEHMKFVANLGFLDVANLRLVGGDRDDTVARR